MSQILYIFAYIMTYENLWRPLTAIYDGGEAKAIIRYVLDVRFGMSATDIYCGKVTQLSADDCHELEKIVSRLMKAEPVQYVLGRADFCGRTLNVGPGVLIPRPETEELCEWIVSSNGKDGKDGKNGKCDEDCGPSILDIGTGSGCIAITLALDIPGASVSAWDMYAEALHIAERNAANLGAKVTFCMQDALDAPRDNARWDIIVSNPPYICQRERSDMEHNVLDHEPHTALFVPDDDPLLFYRAIARYATQALKPDGRLYFEINPLYAANLRDMLRDCGFTTVETRHDSFGKERFAKATPTKPTEPTPPTKPTKPY